MFYVLKINDQSQSWYFEDDLLSEKECRKYKLNKIKNKLWKLKQKNYTNY